MTDLSLDESTAPWWRAFFDDDYAQYGLSSVTPEQNEQIVDLLLRTLAIERGALVFDQCCGVGRLSVALARRGMRVIGVDQAASYIEQARTLAAQEDLDCVFHHHDALHFTAPESCDAAFNWFTSSGYDDDDETNILMLRRAFDSLRSGGRFLLDYQNFPRIFSMFQRAITDRPEDCPDTLVVQESTPDFARGMLTSVWTFFHADGRRVTRQTVTRMYMPHEIIGLFKRCGFDEISLLGGYEGEPFGLTSRRCMVIGRRP